MLLRSPLLPPEAISRLKDKLGTIFTVAKVQYCKQGQKYGHLASVIPQLLDRSGLPDTTVDYKKALEARKLLSASDLHGDRRHSERTTQITTVDYEKALEARKLLSASDLHGNRCHSERTTLMLTQQCRQQALLAMRA